MAQVPFNAIDYLYFNPELQAYSNILTIESASNHYYTDPNGQALMYDATIVPSNLDPYVFLATNKDIIPISLYSQTIFQAMSNDSISLSEIASTAKFISSVSKDAIYTSNNTFALTDMTYTLNTSNFNIGDIIKVVDEYKSEYVLTVNAYNDLTKQITVNSHKYDLYITSNYYIDGIKAYDPLRIANLALVRFGSTTIINTSNTLPESGFFNPTLYKILYPNAARLTDQQAYVDYISKRKNNVLRVNNAEELIVNYIATSNVKVTGVNNTINRALPAGESNRLVTEYAVRQFTETLFGEVANNANFSQVFVTSNFTAEGPATFNDDMLVKSNLRVLNSTILTGQVTLSNTLRVMRTTTFNSNIVVDKNALIYGSLSVNGNSYNPRIGIGYYMDTANTSNSSSSCNLSPVTQAQVDALSNILYPSSNYTYTNIPSQSNILYRTSNFAYSNIQQHSNILYPLSNYVYPRTFNISGSNLYVQSNVNIGFGSSSNSLSVLGQIYSSYDSNWSTGGLRFQSSSGSNDSGIAQGSNGFLRFLSPSNDGAGGFQWINSARNTILMQLNQTGNLNVYADIVGNTNISDKRFKDNIYTFSNYDAYLSKLTPVTFTWASNAPNKEKVGQEDIGLIAQEVADVFSQAHKLTEFGGETINIVKYEKFVPILLSACKDFQERIIKLEQALLTHICNK
jgi:hypothetical protein